MTATRQVIAEHGVAGATSRAITGAAGENLASITYYFGSKDALVTAALIAHVRELIAPVLDELAEERSPADKLARSVARLGALFSAHRADLPAYVECLSLAGRDERVGDEVRSLFDQVTASIAVEIARHQSTGAIPPWADPAVMARLMIGLVNGVILGAVVDPSSSSTEAFAIGQQFMALAVAAAGPARAPAS